MALSRDQVKSSLTVELKKRFPARKSFPEELKISKLNFPSSASRREWGKKLNQVEWYSGWFTPSEFLACVTIGKDPESDPKDENLNLIDLMFSTQGRAPENTALANEFFEIALHTGRQASKKSSSKKSVKNSRLK